MFLLLYINHIPLLQGEQGFEGSKGETGEKVNISLEVCTCKNTLGSWKYFEAEYVTSLVPSKEAIQ